MSIINIFNGYLTGGYNMGKNLNLLFLNKMEKIDI